MHPGSAVRPATRLAALDQLRRVIYLGGFSKTLSANLRVGFIAPSGEWAQRLAYRKMLATLTSSDIGERVIDTNALTEKAMAESVLLAPGSLFSPSQLPSSRRRLNVAAMQEPAVWRFFERELARRARDRARYPGPLALQWRK